MYCRRKFTTSAGVSRYPFEHALAGLADFKPRLKTHGLDRVVDEVLSYGRESTACLRIVIV